MASSSNQVLGSSTVASIKKEYDEETVGSINLDEENCSSMAAAAMKKEEDDDETVCPINVEVHVCDALTVTMWGVKILTMKALVKKSHMCELSMLTFISLLLSVNYC